MDVVGGEEREQCITAKGKLRPYQYREVRMIGDCLAPPLDTANTRNPLKPFAITLVDQPPLPERIIQALQLQEAKGCVNFAELTVCTGQFYGASVGRQAKVLQLVDAPLGRLVATDDSAALEGAEHLGSVETQGHEVAVAQQAAVCILNTESMCRVIDHLQAMALGNRAYCLDITGMAVAVYRQDGCGLVGDGRFDACRVKVQGVRVDIDEHRRQIVP
ncbi:hypothetical protein D3C81_1258260 [compost metagenome]